MDAEDKARQALEAFLARCIEQATRARLGAIEFAQAMRLVEM